MVWKGFITESKLFCDYDKKPFNQKIIWWFECIFSAGPRFYFYQVRDRFYGFKFRIQNFLDYF